MNPEPRDGREDDREAVGRFLRTRSEAAFLDLYDRHTPALYRFAARLCAGARDEPAELVQEAWTRAVERLPQFRFGSSLSTWLCGFVFNGWRERRRAVGRDRRILALVEPEPRARETDRALAVALERVVSELPDGYREVLLLHDVEGYTHEEIARHFGIAEGTSKSQLHRARRALRAALEEKGAGHGG